MSGVAYNGIEKIDVKGKDILIIGAGAIGLLGAAVAKALGITKWSILKCLMYLDLQIIVTIL